MMLNAKVAQRFFRSRNDTLAMSAVERPLADAEEVSARRGSKRNAQHCRARPMPCTRASTFSSKPCYPMDQRRVCADPSRTSIAALRCQHHSASLTPHYRHVRDR